MPACPGRRLFRAHHYRPGGVRWPLTVAGAKMEHLRCIYCGEPPAAEIASGAIGKEVP